MARCKSRLENPGESRVLTQNRVQDVTFSEEEITIDTDDDGDTSNDDPGDTFTQLTRTVTDGARISARC